MFQFLLRSYVVLVLAGLTLHPVRAEVTIDITQGKADPIPIALTDLFGETPETAQVGLELTEIVANDLKSSGLFRPLEKSSFIPTVEQIRSNPHFADWRLINAQAMMRGEVRQEPDGRLRVEFRLFDVVREVQMEGMAYFTKKEEMRRVAHKIADAIYKAMTGDEGYFDTRIVYVSQKGPLQKMKKRLSIMDSDGHNNTHLSDGNTLVLTPRFSPNAEEICYLDFAGLQPKVYLMKLRTGQKQLLGSFKGMTFAPRFSPDGNEVCMSYSHNGRTSLYKMNLRTKETQRLTDGPYIDTSPSFSPDGSKIVFNSDRGGKPQLYVMSSYGSEPERISFGKGRYLTPVWSPRGDLIAFTKIYKGGFYIGVMRPDGSGERLIAQGWVVEDPSWSPNGRVIMFSRQFPGGKSGVYQIDLTGYNERRVPTATDAAGASWSGQLK